MELQVKSCTRCKISKPLNASQFPLHNKTLDGFDSWCRRCRSTYRNEIRRGRFRNVISDVNLKELITSTASCVICDVKFTSESYKVVDHDHKTEEIRGILCNHCNRGLGHFRDDPDLLEYARIYILSSRGDQEADDYIESSNGQARPAHFPKAKVFIQYDGECAKRKHQETIHWCYTRWLKPEVFRCQTCGNNWRETYPTK